MKTIAIRIGMALTLAGCLTLGACKTPGSTDGEARTGHSLVQGAKASKTDVMAQKHKAKKTTTMPKAIPAAVTSGDKKVEPPQITDYTGLETWEFADVDLDGGGDLEEGVALYDSKTDTLYVWWSDAIDLGGDGDVETFDGFFWINDASCGLILDLQNHDEDDVLACVNTKDGFEGFLCRNIGGTTEVMALEASYKK